MFSPTFTSRHELFPYIFVPVFLKIRVLQQIYFTDNFLQLILEFLIFVLQANLSNQMICSNSVIVKAENFIGLRQPSLSIILNFSGDAGVRIIPHLNFNS